MKPSTVIPLPVNWERSSNVTNAEGVTCPAYRATVKLDDGAVLVGVIEFDGELVAWKAFGAFEGVSVYSGEHREKDEAAGSVVAAFQRALDIRRGR